MITGGSQSGDEFAHYIPCDVGQTVVPPAVVTGQLFVIHAHEMENRGVEVVDVNFIGGHGGCDFIRSAPCHTAFDAPAGKP